MKWFVYFLTSTKRNWIHVGMTNDVMNRVQELNNGLVQSTKFFAPLTLKGYVAVETATKARALERYFKGDSGKAFLKKRILTDEAPFSGT